MDKLWLLGVVFTVAISNLKAEELTLVDEYYLVGLRNLYKFANLSVGDHQAPYAVLALDFAGYRLPKGFQRPGQTGFRRRRVNLWPCKANYSWPIENYRDSTVMGVQDFNKDGMITYHKLLEKYNVILRDYDNIFRRRLRHREVHVFFSHLPNPTIFHAFATIARSMPDVTYTIGYYHDAPNISGVDVTESLHNTAMEIVKEETNINFGRIEGKNTSMEGLKKPWGSCLLDTVPAVKYPGLPEPEVFNAMYRSLEPEKVGEFTRGPGFYYRDEEFQGNMHDYCGRDGNSQLATVEQLRRTANNGYKFPCSYLADGIPRAAIETCDGKVEVRECRANTDARFLCSGKKASVMYVTRQKSSLIDIVDEGNERCMDTLGTYLVGIKELEEAVSVGYYNTKCGYTTDGKLYRVIIVGNNYTSLELVECSGKEIGFYCDLKKPEVFRWPVHKEEEGYKTVEDANKACVDEGYHLATLRQLRQSWSRGLDYCDCGFLHNGAVMYPINDPRYGCEMYGPGLRQCPGDPRQWDLSGWAAYCSNTALPIVPQETNFTDWQVAMDICKKRGRALASLELYKDAVELGFRDDRCLMTANGRSYTFDEEISRCSTPSNFYCSRYQVPVFNIGSSVFTWEERAEAACQEQGSTLATEELLELAYRLGYDQCSCGYLRGGKVKYPINRPRDGCSEMEVPGLRDCPVSPTLWNTDGWDAYCVSIQT